VYPPLHCVIVTERLGEQPSVEAESTAREIARTPLRRLGLSADVAKAAVFLACDDACYITGTTIVVDGGAMAVW
jgi:NAD(P)-dependent dehydrogenase (short-subunit alcohol dehydrogenase family)